jgi:hypothetical protein
MEMMMGQAMEQMMVRWKVSLWAGKTEHHLDIRSVGWKELW